jgi:hypothetical protein
MAFLLGMLALVCGVASLVCWVMVLIAIFKANEIWQGIVGIICPLFAFIWGWMHADRLGVRKIMPIWTAAVVAGIVLNILTAVVAPRGATPILTPPTLTTP